MESSSIATREARVRRMARRHGLTAKKQNGGWQLIETLSHAIIQGKTTPLTLSQVEAHLENLERLPGGQG